MKILLLVILTCLTAFSMSQKTWMFIKNRHNKTTEKLANANSTCSLVVPLLKGSQLHGCILTIGYSVLLP